MTYLLFGPEDGLKADWLADEKKRVLSAHPDAEVHQLFVGDDRGEDLEAVLMQPSLFSTIRFVIVKQYENRTAKDGFEKAVVSFIESGGDDAELIVISSEKSKSKVSQKIQKAPESKVRIIFFWELFDSQKRTWIRNAFQKEGFSITADAVSELLYSVDNNTAEMRNLVSAISLYFNASGRGGGEITSDDIRKYSVQTRGEDGSTLFQAIAESDLDHAEAIIASILSTDSAAPVRAFSTVVSKFRMLESFESLKAEGYHDERAFSEADCLSPYPSFFPTKGIRKTEWPLYRKAAEAYPLEDTRRIISYLGKMDSEMKNAPSEWQLTIFSTVVAAIIHFKGRVTGIEIDSSPLGSGIQLRN